MSTTYSPLMTGMALAVLCAAPAQEELWNGKDLTGFYTYLKNSGRNNDPDKVFQVHDGLAVEPACRTPRDGVDVSRPPPGENPLRTLPRSLAAAPRSVGLRRRLLGACVERLRTAGVLPRLGSDRSQPRGAHPEQPRRRGDCGRTSGPGLRRLPPLGGETHGPPGRRHRLRFPEAGDRAGHVGPPLAGPLFLRRHVSGGGPNPHAGRGPGLLAGSPGAALAGQL